MMMLKKITMIGGLSVLAACAVPASENPVLANTQPETPVQAASEVAATPQVQVASEIATQPESESLPYPDLDKQKQIDQLSIKIKKMEQKIAQLNTRISQLERRAAAPAPQKSPPPKARPNNKPRTVKISQTPPEKQPETVQNEPLELPVNPLRVAQDLYAKKQYHAAIEQLRGADSGGDGSLNAQQQMYLLLQSHLKLQHCQSVIQIGRQFASRFADNANAPHALFAVGQCQWQIQQRDIAKDTWRDIMRRYPKSPIASAAERAMKQK